LDEIELEGVVWVPTKSGNHYQVFFSVDLYDNDPTLEFLKSKGIGTKQETAIGYIPFGLYFCDEIQDSEYDSDENENNFG